MLVCLKKRGPGYVCGVQQALVAVSRQPVDRFVEVLLALVFADVAKGIG